MDRDTRNILNLKQPNLFSHGAVSIDGMSDGQITISKGYNQQTTLSLKKDGRIYKTNMSSNGNQYVDKDLKVNGSINLSNKLIIKNYPAFYVYQSTSVDAQSIASGSTYYRIILDTEHYDNGSNFDVSGYKFTAPYNGIYHFDANVLLDNNQDTDAGDWADESRVDIHLFKNQGDATTTNTSKRVASSLHLLSGAITDNFWQGNLSSDLKLDAGDFIELYVKQDSGVEQHTHAPTGGDFTRFTGHLICAL